MQQIMYDEAPYHILFYPNQLDANRTDRFGGWRNQPSQNGNPLFGFGSLDYTYLTDAKAVVVPSASPSSAASASPGSSEAAVASAPAPTASAAPDTTRHDLELDAAAADRDHRPGGHRGRRSAGHPAASRGGRGRVGQRSIPGDRAERHERSVPAEQGRAGDRHDRPAHHPQLRAVPDDAGVARADPRPQSRTSARRRSRRPASAGVSTSRSSRTSS